MALQINYHLNNGIQCQDAYVRITRIFIETPRNDIKNCLNAEVEIYYNKDARDNNLSPVDRVTFCDTYDEQTQQFDKTSLYNWLKTQPMFENAVDV